MRTPLSLPHPPSALPRYCTCLAFSCRELDHDQALLRRVRLSPNESFFVTHVRPRVLKDGNQTRCFQITPPKFIYQKHIEPGFFRPIIMASIVSLGQRSAVTNEAYICWGGKGERGVPFVLSTTFCLPRDASIASRDYLIFTLVLIIPARHHGIKRGPALPQLFNSHRFVRVDSYFYAFPGRGRSRTHHFYYYSAQPDRRSSSVPRFDHRGGMASNVPGKNVPSTSFCNTSYLCNGHSNFSSFFLFFSEGKWGYARPMLVPYSTCCGASQY